MRNIGYIFICLAILLSSCSEFQKIQKSENLDSKYESAIAYYNKGDYYRAGLLFEELIPLFMGKKEAELSQFYYSYCHFHQGQLYLASYYFDSFAKTFPRSEKVEEAMFMNCKSIYLQTPASNLEQNSTEDALNAIQMFTNKFPKSEYIDRCNNMVDELNVKLEKKEYDNAKLYHKLHYYKAAVIAFDNFIQLYPGSKYMEEILFLKVDAQYNLANISIYSKQKERYMESVDFYRNYADKFPNGKYFNQAEALYDRILSGLEKVKSREELNKYEITRTSYNQKKYNQALDNASEFLVSFPSSKYLDEMSYLKCSAQYNLAKASTEEGQMELFNKTVEYYKEYKARFPQGKSTKKVEGVYTQTMEELKKLEANR